METYQFDGLVSFTLSILLLFVGKLTLQRYELLRRYSIPEPLIGGLLCAGTVGAVYFTTGLQVSFELEVRDWLLLYFFAAIGLKSDLGSLAAGGRPLVILVVLATVFVVLQNAVGIGAATAFGMDPKAGLMAGSISLTGGVGTALAWAPLFVDQLGIQNAFEIAVACNTVGLIAACCIGGPIAAFLIGRHRLLDGDKTELDVGVSHETDSVPVDSYAVLFAWFWLNVALILGQPIHLGLQAIGLQVPQFVACLIAGILLKNGVGRIFPQIEWEGGPQALAVITDLCLGMFLTMALMALQLWELQGTLLFITIVMTAQIALSIAFTLVVVFRGMGRDYEASVVSAGFGGITLGSTATAIVNMTAVAKEHGAAPRAFLVVPLVCGFFVDLINALVINVFVGL